MAIPETLIQGINEELKQRMQEIANKYMPRVNNFYQQSSRIMAAANIGSLNSLKSINSNIFEQMKYTQIKNEDLKITNSLQQARNSFNKYKIQKYLNDLNQLLGEGYSILTELGEEIRGREIKYMITYISTSGGQEVLKQRVLDLKQFTSTFNLDDSGKIHFLDIESLNIEKENSVIDKLQWAKLKEYQSKKRKEEKDKLENEKLESAIENYMYKNQKDSIREIIEDKRLRQRIYKQINKKENKNKTAKEIIKLVDRAINLSYNNGRLIELGANLIEQNRKFNNENMDNLYEEDPIAFYKQGDFMLNGIEYQSKLSKASTSLSTIINGMQELTSYFSNFYNETSRISSYTDSDGKEAENKVYAKLENELLQMFTV